MREAMPLAGTSCRLAARLNLATTHAALGHGTQVMHALAKCFQRRNKSLETPDGPWLPLREHQSRLPVPIGCLFLEVVLTECIGGKLQTAEPLGVMTEDC